MNSDFNIQAWATAMSLRLKRHGAIAGNIANADTPGYRPKQVAFEDALKDAVKTRSFDKLDRIEAKTITIDDGIARPDGNSVNLDKQMGTMSENTLIYTATAEFLSKKFKMLRAVIG